MKTKKSTNLKELRNMAIAITKENRISVNYVETERTAFIDLESLQIVVTPQLIPKKLHDSENLFKKCLDGQLVHEAGHYLLTKPLLSRYERFENKTRLKKLAHTITNIVEDKRVNHFCEKRYRFDFGEKLLWFRGIMRKAQTSTLESKMQELDLKNESKPALMLNQLIHVGLYDGETDSNVMEILDKQQQKDLETALNILDKVKYKYIKQDVINSAKEIYQLIEKHVKSYQDIQEMLKFTPTTQNGEGGLEVDLNEEDAKNLGVGKADQNEPNSEKQDCKQGGGCGVANGDLIPVPPSNLKRYSEYVARTQSETTKLLNKLKQLVKPIRTKLLFQKQGRIMSPIIARAYSNSFRNNAGVSNIYTNAQITYEKQEVALAFAIDFSGSMNGDVSRNIVTIMNEVFGNYLTDESFAITVFGADYQKIKAFNEQYQTTKGRIGGINVNSGGTMSANLCNDIRKMFQTINNEKKKVFVFCTDFSLGDELETIEAINGMINDGVEILFIGLCDYWNRSESFMPNTKGIRRARCENLSELPEKFIDIYLNSIGNVNK